MMNEVLDIGCGINARDEATVVLDLRDDYADVYKGKKEVIVHDCNNLPLPFANATFDKVHCHSMVEHIDVSLEAFCAEVHRILKPNGFFEMSCPNALFLWFRLQYLFGWLPQNMIYNAHKKQYSYKYVEFVLYNVGFKMRPLYNLRRFLPFRNALHKDTIFIFKKVQNQV